MSNQAVHPVFVIITHSASRSISCLLSRSMQQRKRATRSCGVCPGRIRPCRRGCWTASSASSANGWRRPKRWRASCAMCVSGATRRCVSGRRGSMAPPRPPNFGGSQFLPALRRVPPRIGEGQPPPASGDRVRRVPPRIGQGQPPPASRDRVRRVPPRIGEGQPPPASGDRVRRVPPRIGEGQPPPASGDRVRRVPPRIGEGQLPPASGDRVRRVPPRIGQGQLPPASGDRVRRVPPRIGQGQPPPASRDRVRRVPPRIGEGQPPPASGDRVRRVPPRIGEGQPPPASGDRVRRVPPRIGEGQPPPASGDRVRRVPPRIGGIGGRSRPWRFPPRPGARPTTGCRTISASRSTWPPTGSRHSIASNPWTLGWMPGRTARWAN